MKNLYDLCVQNFLKNLRVKEFGNWSVFADVMIKSQVYCFFDSQCSCMLAVQQVRQFLAGSAGSDWLGFLAGSPRSDWLQFLACSARSDWLQFLAGSPGSDWLGFLACSARSDWLQFLAGSAGSDWLSCIMVACMFIITININIVAYDVSHTADCYCDAGTMQECSDNTARQLHEDTFTPPSVKLWSQSKTLWSCSLCGAWLGSSRTLRNHVRKKHMALKTERCRLCGETFRWAGQVVRHKRLCHPESV